MDILIVCKLADTTLRENVLTPLLSSKTVSHIYVLRDTKSDEMGGRVSYLSRLPASFGMLRNCGAASRPCADIRLALLSVSSTHHMGLSDVPSHA